MNTPHKQEPVSTYTHSKTYSIRKHTNVYRYRVTVPNTVFEQANIKNGDTLSMCATVSDDGFLEMVYSTNQEQFNSTVSASKHSSGELTIFSGLGAATTIDDYNIEWTLEIYEDVHLLRGKTTLFLREYLLTESELLDIRNLKHVQQNVNYQGNDWEQEHFQLYLNTDSTRKLNWTDGENVTLQIGQANGNIILIFTPEHKRNTDCIDKNIKQVRKTGDIQQDRLLYVPNDIVRALQFIQAEVRLLNDNQTLLIVPEFSNNTQEI